MGKWKMNSGNLADCLIHSKHRATYKNMLPILYSYRRCPYAIRARMALQYAGIQVEHREIVLRDKPQSMLKLSPKGTVPVLSAEGLILDQSIDIMHWALSQSDPDGWLRVDRSQARIWIDKNDGPFKIMLDQYKYPNRYPELNQAEVLNAALDLMLLPVEKTLQSSHYLLGEKMSWVDIAIFPFIRQFKMAQPQQFETLALDLTQAWLNEQLESTLFDSAMKKFPSWKD